VAGIDAGSNHFHPHIGAGLGIPAATEDGPQRAQLPQVTR
jgi:hypothetical protein